jgi:hypothetical protein
MFSRTTEIYLTTCETHFTISLISIKVGSTEKDLRDPWTASTKTATFLAIKSRRSRSLTFLMRNLTLRVYVPRAISTKRTKTTCTTSTKSSTRSSRHLSRSRGSPTEPTLISRSTAALRQAMLDGDVCFVPDRWCFAKRSSDMSWATNSSLVVSKFYWLNRDSCKNWKICVA